MPKFNDGLHLMNFNLFRFTIQFLAKLHYATSFMGESLRWAEED